MGRTKSAGVVIGVAFACLVAAGCAPEPVEVTLVYQVDSKAIESGSEADFQQVVQALKHRVGNRGKVVAGADRQIAVGLYGHPDKAQLESITRLLGSMGVLEFRIVADANLPADAPIIEQAKLLPPEETVIKLDDTKVGEWVAYSEAEFGKHNTSGFLVKRMANGVPQALVLTDDWNVTGSYLTSTNKAADEAGRPAISFSLNKEGAKRFHALTSANKPDSAGNRRHLGIILDKNLLAAPGLNEAISERGMISGGSMTERDVELIHLILSAGPLPVPIKLVDVRHSAEAK